MIFKEVLHPLTNVKDAITAIRENRCYPVTRLGGTTYYMFNLDRVGSGNLIYTLFDENKIPVISYLVRYGSYHNLQQIVSNPLPKSQLEKVYDTKLPDGVDDIISVGKIIKHYRDL